MNHTIGVAVPVLNAAATLEWTLLSLLRQQGCEVTAVVADSGSTDGSLEVCAKYGVRVVTSVRGNMYRGVNAGLRALRTPWMTYLNGDDTVYLDSYRRLLELGERSGADVVYGDCDYVDADGRFLFTMHAASPRWLRVVSSRPVMPFNQPCAIFRTELFARLGGFNEEYRTCADFEFFLRAIDTGAKFAYLSRVPVAAFRIHANQITAVHSKLVREELHCLAARIGGDFPWSLLGFWGWRLQNAGPYLMRRYRTGHWHDRPNGG